MKFRIAKRAISFDEKTKRFSFGYFPEFFPGYIGDDDEWKSITASGLIYVGKPVPLTTEEDARKVIEKFKVVLSIKNYPEEIIDVE
jgi:hypothetical protein